MGGGVRRRGGVEGVRGSSVGREHGWGCEEEGGVRGSSAGREHGWGCEEEGWGRGSEGQQCRKGAWVGA